jgi:hypothetical protein
MYKFVNNNRIYFFRKPLRWFDESMLLKDDCKINRKYIDNLKNKNYIYIINGVGI